MICKNKSELARRRKDKPGKSTPAALARFSPFSGLVPKGTMKRRVGRGTTLLPLSRKGGTSFAILKRTNNVVMNLSDQLRG